jgi:hypothetical protein
VKRFLAALLVSPGLVSATNAMGHQVTWIEVSDRYSCVMFEVDNEPNWDSIPRSNKGFIQQLELLHYVSGKPVEFDWAPDGKCDDGASKLQGIAMGVQR